MALSVIGPGFGRTGTASLRRALDLLGFGPCHHMKDVYTHPEQVAHWETVAAGRPIAWDTVFAGYRAQADWPGAHVWRQLAEAYPAAKVVLTVRPEEAWWKSFSATIGTLIGDPDGVSLPPHVRRMLQISREVIVPQTFGGGGIDRDSALAAYRRRIAEVRAVIAPERLLVLDVAEGWAPLCRFLGVAVPDRPFPHINATDQFWAVLRTLGAP